MTRRGFIRLLAPIAVWLCAPPLSLGRLGGARRPCASRAPDARDIPWEKGRYAGGLTLYFPEFLLN